MRTSRRLLKQVRRAMLVAFLFSGFLNLLTLAVPLYTLQVFEQVVPTGSLETLVLLSVIAGTAVLALSLIELTRDMILLRAGLWLDHELGQHILQNGVKLGVPSSELRQDAAALDRFRAFITSSAVGPMFDAPWVPIFLIGLVLLHPVIGGLAIAAVLLLAAAALSQSVLTRRLSEESARSHERSEHWWSTIAGNPELAGALGLANGASEQWERFNRSHIAGSYSLGKRTSLIKAFARFVRVGSQIAVYGLGAWLVVKGELAPGALVASAILIARALAPLEQISASVKATQSALAAYRRLKSLKPDAELAPVSDGESATGRLCFNDVSFYHPGRKTPALRSVSFDLVPGRCLAVVGPNGSGKSTLAGLMGGVLSPTTGSADLDGVPISKWQRGSNVPPIGYLPDDPALIEGSVHDNIARFRGASLISVARAAMRAGVHETLHSLTNAYDTEVGHQGSALALRERRAVALARAVHGDPRIVVLDEPEIGLDGASLRRLLNVLKDLKAEGTGIVVATQDPRLLALADDILVLNQGAITSFGQADEVRRSIGALAPVVVSAAEQRSGGGT